jgi:hypothetical protein
MEGQNLALLSTSARPWCTAKIPQLASGRGKSLRSATIGQIAVRLEEIKEAESVS